MHTVWATFIPRITPGKRPGLRMLLGAFRGGNPLERIVAVPSLWPRPGGVLQQHGMGVLRQHEVKAFVDTFRLVGTDLTRFPEAPFRGTTSFAAQIGTTAGARFAGRSCRTLCGAPARMPCAWRASESGRT